MPIGHTHTPLTRNHTAIRLLVDAPNEVARSEARAPNSLIENTEMNDKFFDLNQLTKQTEKSIYK